MLFRPYRQHLLARKSRERTDASKGGGAERVLLEMEGEVTVRLSWAGPTFLPEQAWK